MVSTLMCNLENPNVESCARAGVGEDPQAKIVVDEGGHVAARHLLAIDGEVAHLGAEVGAVEPSQRRRRPTFATASRSNT